MAIGVVVADDHPLFLRAVADVLHAHAEITVLARAADGIEALAAIEQHQPQAAVLDLRMPRLDGLGVVRQLAASGSTTRVLMLSNDIDAPTVRHALELGALGYLPKEIEDRALCTAVLRVAADLRAVSADLELALRSAPVREVSTLSSREHEVVARVAGGASNTQIALELHLSAETVKNYVARASAKLGTSGRTALAVEAVRRGLI